MREAIDRQCGPHTYRITKLGGLEGHKLYGQIAKLAAKATNDQELAADLLLAPGIVEAFCRNTLLLGPNGATPVLWNVFDAHFSGDMEGLGEFLQAAIEVNFPKRKRAQDASASEGENPKAT